MFKLYFLCCCTLDFVLETDITFHGSAINENLVYINYFTGIGFVCHCSNCLGCQDQYVNFVAGKGYFIDGYLVYFDHPGWTSWRLYYSFVE